MIAGWGLIDEDRATSRLFETQVSIYSRRKCSLFYPHLDSGMVCAGSFHQLKDSSQVGEGTGGVLGGGAAPRAGDKSLRTVPIRIWLSGCPVAPATGVSSAQLLQIGQEWSPRAGREQICYHRQEKKNLLPLKSTSSLPREILVGPWCAIKWHKELFPLATIPHPGSTPASPTTCPGSERS